MLDPHEADSPVSQDGRQRSLLLFIHQQGHEMLDLGHVHISTVITADQHLGHTQMMTRAGYRVRYFLGTDRIPLITLSIEKRLVVRYQVSIPNAEFTLHNTR